MRSSARRDFLKAGAASLLFPGYLVACPLAGPALSRDPFQLGVASGEPAPDGFVIWTRLAPEPLSPDALAGMPPEPVEIEWFVSDQAGGQSVVQKGRAHTDPEWAHAIHVQINGLQPDRHYWYGFRTRDAQSPIGRARTTPTTGAPLDRLRFAFASCQNFEHGYYAAWRHLAARHPDLIIHLGDYIYESSGSDVVRAHLGGQARTLAAYRARYAQYKSDPDLQAAHAAASWLVSWDDHEVDNDYAGLNGSERTTDIDGFRARRAAAYKAWWEHMPVLPAMRPIGEALPLYRRVSYGNLAQFHVLDSRQYRADQACGTAQKRGGQVTGDCAERHDPARSLLGEAQEQWLMAGLSDSTEKWNVLTQSMMMATLDQQPGSGQAWWTDGWDGYPLSRDRLLDFMDEHRVSNPLVISGDIHSFWANELQSPTETGRVIASELVGSSISSRSISHDKFTRFLPDNPHVQFFDSRYRGFVMCEMSHRHCKAAFHAVTDARHRHSDTFKLAGFVVEDGAPGPQIDDL